jgi:uncharacterized protein (DUF427 family)
MTIVSTQTQTKTQYVVKDRASNAVIAAGVKDETVRDFEGNWYFSPTVVNMDYLNVTERTYTCPYKGVCFWVDAVSPTGEIARNVAWVYRDPKPGYEFIKDEMGFYARNSSGTLVEKK